MAFHVVVNCHCIAARRWTVERAKTLMGTREAIRLSFQGPVDAATITFSLPSWQKQDDRFKPYSFFWARPTEEIEAEEAKKAKKKS